MLKGAAVMPMPSPSVSTTNAGRPLQAAERVADVVDEVGEPADAPRIARRFLLLRHASHLPQRRVACLRFGEPAGDPLARQLVDVELHLVVELPLDAAAAQE